MLPYFTVSGHHLYVRLAHIYLQKMQNLEVTNKKICERFQNGYRVVRGSQKFWGGLLIDLIIVRAVNIYNVKHAANLRLTWVSLQCEF